MSAIQVLVTGATGRTGSFVIQKLRQSPDQFLPLGFARSCAKVKEKFGSTDGFFYGDVRDQDSLKPAMIGCHALVILTSAIPQLKSPPNPAPHQNLSLPPEKPPKPLTITGKNIKSTPPKYPELITLS